MHLYEVDLDVLCVQDIMAKPFSYQRQFCGFSSNEDCLPIPGCGNPAAATMFYHSFTLLISYVFMNLFVAVILEGFSIAEYVFESGHSARVAAVAFVCHVCAVFCAETSKMRSCRKNT